MHVAEANDREACRLLLQGEAVRLSVSARRHFECGDTATAADIACARGHFVLEDTLRSQRQHGDANF